MRDVWSTKLDYVQECSETKPPAIYVAPNVIGKILYLLDRFEGVEWAADLLGYTDDAGDYYIEDVYLFEQDVSAVSVERKEPPPTDAIGTTHSHHSMGAFFSATDDEYPNENHDLSGVISNSPQGGLPFTMLFTVRKKTPCGKLIRFNDVPATVWVEKIPVKEVENVVRRASFSPRNLYKNLR